jgi:hypothetical protein
MVVIWLSTKSAHHTSVDVGCGPNHTQEKVLDTRTATDRRTQQGCHSFVVKNGDFSSKPPKNNQRAYVTKTRLVFRQTSKETAESLAREGPRQGKDIVGLP